MRITCLATLLLTLVPLSASAKPPPDPLPYNLTCEGETFQATIIQGGYVILGGPQEALMLTVLGRTWTHDTVSMNLGEGYKALVIKRASNHYEIVIRMPDDSMLAGTCTGKSK